MNLCDFCRVGLNKKNNCHKLNRFIRPTGQRVFCCTDFEQYPVSYADLTYTDFEYPSTMHVIGCVSSLPLKLERNKNQINYQL